MRLVKALLPLPLLSILLAAAGCAGTRGPATTAAPSPAPADLSRDDAGPQPLAEPDAPLPLDPAVRHGVLANGLTFYVRANARPAKRAELRLVVNAGSVLEDDDQRGLAHFCEHMAFNGTEHFRKQELVDYLERIGMRFGPDVNAYTSFDETVYVLQVPTDDAAIVGKAFDILEDWAHRATYDDDEIDKERGVVVEEWRLGRGAQARVRDRQFPVLFRGSRYADRLVIGDKDVLLHAPHDALRRFYRDWYRPDLMAVVAVGDFDPEAIERLVREHFSRIRGPETPRERRSYRVPDNDAPLVSIATDPELSSTSVTLVFKRDAEPLASARDLGRVAVDRLYNAMLNDRLQELATRPDPPFLGAGSSSGRWVRTEGVYTLGASVPPGGLERGLEALLTEARRVELHGFTASELERAKSDYLRRMEQALAERDKRESWGFASEYVRNFLTGEAAPGVELEHALMARTIPAVTLDEVDARARAWITPRNRVVLVSAPDSEAASLPDRDRLLAAIDAAGRREVAPYVDAVSDAPLVATPPKPGKVVREEKVDAVGVTAWTLSNGVRVLLKPTDFKNDQVLIRAFSPGGTSLVDDASFVSASLAASVVREGGLGEFGRVELDKKLAGKVAWVGPFIGELEEGVTGSASPKDLDTLFRLVYLTFTAPRRDPGSFEAFVARTRASLENRENDPGVVFSRELARRLSQGHPRRRPLTPEVLRELDLDRALEVYRDRFADASDFTFVLVGSFDPDAVRPLVETWIGGLPGLGRKETWRDVGVRPPDGVVRFEVRKGIEPKSRVQVVFRGETPWSLEADHVADALVAALRIRLREVLREDLGGVYGVGVSGGLERRPIERYGFSVGFGCDPARVDELVAAAFREIEAFRRDGPPASVVEKVREAERRGRETDLRDNRFWAGTLEFYADNGLDPAGIPDYERLVDLVTTGSLRDAARRWLDPAAGYVEGVLLPE